MMIILLPAAAVHVAAVAAVSAVSAVVVVVVVVVVVEPSPSPYARK